MAAVHNSTHTKTKNERIGLVDSAYHISRSSQNICTWQTKMLFDPEPPCIGVLLKPQWHGAAEAGVASI